MGCGASSVYGPDGNIVAGKGESTVKLNPDVPLEVLFYCGPEHGDATCEIKKLPLPTMSTEEQKKCGQYLTEGIKKGSAPGTSWITVEPYVMYEQRYSINGWKVRGPESTPLEICRRLGKKHQEKPEEFTNKTKKMVEKDKDHPYNQPGGDDLLKGDLDKLSTAKSAADLDDRLPLKKLIQGIESALPMNAFRIDIGIKDEIGTWDASNAQVLGMVEKGRIMAEAKALTPANVAKILLKKNDAQHKFLSTALMGCCKALGVEVAELAPLAGDGFDEGVGRRNGFVPLTDIRAAPAGAPAEPPKELSPEEREAERVKEVKEQVAAESKFYDEWKKADSRPLDARKGEVENAVIESYKVLQPLSKAVAAHTANDTPVVARFEAREGMYEGLASPSGGESANLVWGDSLLDNGTAANVPDKAKRQVFDFASGEPKEQEVVNIIALGPNVDVNDLNQGERVRFRKSGTNYWQSGNFYGADGDKVTVYDATTEYYEISPKDIWRDTSVYTLTTRPHLLPASTYSITFSWIAAADETTKEVNLWQDENKEATKQVLTLVPFTKTTENGATIHRGYSVSTTIVAHTTYCYNFKIGDKYYFEFGKEAPSADACKKFHLDLTVS